mmetsp:Transcript_134860/g.419016  ORF Transcript_134860/g.419016 Transcript_134860/m.419016 type:complete len:123 (-) Transcript_134860:38-406(-)
MLSVCCGGGGDRMLRHESVQGLRQRQRDSEDDAEEQPGDESDAKHVRDVCTFGHPTCNWYIGCLTCKKMKDAQKKATGENADLAIVKRMLPKSWTCSDMAGVAQLCFGGILVDSGYAQPQPI